MSKRSLLWVKWGLLCVIVALRFIQLSKKAEFHPDEVYSLMIAQCNPSFYTAPDEGEYTGLQLQSLLIANHNLVDDLAELHQDNHDVPHASIYYMILRCALCGYDSWQPSELAMRGGLLNIIFLIFSYILLWRLVEHVSGKNTLMVAACCAAAFLNPGAGECALLVREYQLAMLAVIAFTYSLNVMVKRLSACTGWHRSLWKPVCILTLSIVLCLSTGYMNIVYLCALALGIWIYTTVRCKRIDVRYVVIMITCAAAGVLLSWLIYRGFFNFILCNSVHKSKAFSSPAYSVTTALVRDILKLALTVPFALMLGTILLAVLMRRVYTVKVRGILFAANCKDKMYAWPLMLTYIICAVFTIVVVQYASLLREARYTYPYTPMLCFMLPCVAASFRDRCRNILALITIVYFLIHSLCYSAPTTEYDWQHRRHLLRGGAVLHNLNANELPLLYPYVSESARYTILHSPQTPDFNRSTTVVHYWPSISQKDYHIERVVGPLRVVSHK